MIRAMKARISVVLLCACAMAAAAQDTPEARAAHYYAQGLERPLLQLRTGAQLVQACADRLKRACDQEQRRLAAGNRVLDLLDALTLFPQRLEAHPAASVSKARELRQKIGETSATLMREAGRYDLDLMARYGATLLACPPEDGVDTWLSGLVALRLIDLVGFQGMSAADAGVASSANIQAMGEESVAWRDRPREDCLAARKLGEYLMQLLDAKLQPWSNPPPEAGGDREFDFSQPKKVEPRTAMNDPQKRELARAVAGNFVSVVATELQLIAVPESAPRIKDLADQAGFPSQD
jgi:hypothetical protein